MPAAPVIVHSSGMGTNSSALVALSNELAATIERVAPSVVAIDGDRFGASGFAVGAGLIVTASHAVDDDEATLTFHDGTTVDAAIAGRDSTTDIAIFRLEADASPSAVKFASIDTVRAGHVTLAIARDDDNDVSASMGVVSTVGAAWQTWRGGAIDRFVRPDLSLYRRFSGGPLVDVNGNVIGMNTLGLSRRTALTVPAATLQRVVTDLAERGHVARGYLGLAMQAVRGGVIVLSVEPGGPADRAGFLVGDVLTELAGRTIDDVDDVQAVLGPQSVGQTVAVRLIRAGNSHSASVTVATRANADR